MYSSRLPCQLTNAVCCWHEPVAQRTAHPVTKPWCCPVGCGPTWGACPCSTTAAAPSTPKSLAAERRSTFLHAIQRLEVSLCVLYGTWASQVLASTASAKIMTGILSAAYLDVVNVAMALLLVWSFH